jgi:hypothetical protein
LKREETKMNRKQRQKAAEDSAIGEKLLRSVQQARDWVNGKAGRALVAYVAVPRVDVGKSSRLP